MKTQITSDVTFTGRTFYLGRDGKRIDDDEVLRILNAHDGLAKGLRDAAEEIASGSEGSVAGAIAIIEAALKAAGEKP